MLLSGGDRSRQAVGTETVEKRGHSMAGTVIHEHSSRVRSPDGTTYRARVLGAERKDGTWSGWIEFTPTSGPREPVSTGQETSQPNRMTLDYWAGGLEPIYLEGALERALRSDKGSG